MVYLKENYDAEGIQHFPGEGVQLFLGGGDANFYRNL